MFFCNSLIDKMRVFFLQKKKSWDINLENFRNCSVYFFWQGPNKIDKVSILQIKYGYDF